MEQTIDITRPALPVFIQQFAESSARAHPDAVAIRDRHGDLTHAAVWARSGQLSSWLRGRGVGQGDRVLLRLRNSREFVLLFHAALRVGAVVVPTSPDLRAAQVAHIVRDCAPVLCVVEGDDAEFSAEGCPTVDVATAMAKSQAEPADLDEAGRFGAALASPQDVAFLIYTSGSTAAPKGVVCPHEQVVFAAGAIAERLGYRETDVVYCRLPFSFDYGLYQILLACLAGAALALPESASDVQVLKEVRSAGATIVPVVPTLATVLAVLATRDRRPTAVRRFTNTGAELTAEHSRRLRETFPDAEIISMYGMTECKRITISGPDDDLARPGTVGKALTGTEVVVIDELGAPVAAGTVGEVVVRGPHVMAGYWNAPEETAKRYRPNQTTGATELHTGDFGWLDDAGDLHLVGRRDDIFKRRGVRVSTAEIEAAVLTVDGVREAAVVPDVPSLGLVLWYAGTITADALRAELPGILDAARLPDRILCRPELPRTAHGKLDRRWLVENIASTGRDHG